MFGSSNPKFRNRAIMLLVIGFLCYYLFCVITAGCPNLNPSINTYVYGHKNFLAASRVVMAA